VTALARGLHQAHGAPDLPQANRGAGHHRRRREEGDFWSSPDRHTHDQLLCFTDRGRVYKDRCSTCPSSALREGPPDRQLPSRWAAASASSRSLPIATSPTRSADPLRDAQGLRQATSLGDFQNIRRGGIIALNLEEGGRGVSACALREGQQVVLATAKGMAIRFVLDESVRLMAGRRSASSASASTRRTASSTWRRRRPGQPPDRLRNGYGIAHQVRRVPARGEPQNRRRVRPPEPLAGPDRSQRRRNRGQARDRRDDVICIAEKGQRSVCRSRRARHRARHGRVRLMEMARPTRSVSVAASPPGRGVGRRPAGAAAA